MICSAVSVRQPWAAATLYLPEPKNVENRTWPMPDKLVGKKILLHAGKAMPRAGEWNGALYERAMQARPMLYGGIIGLVVFGPPVRDHASPWAETGYWHWPIEQVRPCEFFPCLGRLNFFPVDVSDSIIHHNSYGNL